MGSGRTARVTLSQSEAGNTLSSANEKAGTPAHRGLINSERCNVMTINNDRSNKTRVIIATLSEYHRLDQELQCHKTHVTWADLTVERVAGLTAPRW